MSECDEPNRVQKALIYHQLMSGTGHPSDSVQVSSILAKLHRNMFQVSSVKFSAIIRLIQFVIFVADLTQLHLESHKIRI